MTHNERRFQFRLFTHLFRIVPCVMGNSRIHRWWSPSDLETEIRSGTWAKRLYIWRLLSSCRKPLTSIAQAETGRAALAESVAYTHTIYICIYSYAYICKHIYLDIHVYQLSCLSRAGGDRPCRGLARYIYVSSYRIIYRAGGDRPCCAGRIGGVGYIYTHIYIYIYIYIYVNVYLSWYLDIDPSLL